MNNKKKKSNKRRMYCMECGRQFNPNGRSNSLCYRCSSRRKKEKKRKKSWNKGKK